MTNFFCEIMNKLLDLYDLEGPILDREDDWATQASFKIAIMGDPMSGKTSLWKEIAQN